MNDRIKKLLSERAPLKAKEIARELELDKSDVNAFLYKNSEDYIKDDEHRWSPVEGRELELILPGEWVQAEAFEDIFRSAGCALDTGHQTIRIVFSPKCKVMIACTARLLALINQLAYFKDAVTVDFTNAPQTCMYLNRAGFFDLLREEVTVLPYRPKRSAAVRYQGQSETLVEFGAVDPMSGNAGLIEHLTEKFVQGSSPDYQVAAYTLFGELIGNVREHSQSPLNGFAGLQKYGGSRPHIQTVVTDSGVGIVRTLRPTLETYHPRLYKKFGEPSVESDIGIVTAAMTEGGISRLGAGRGLGFKSSSELAIKFNAIFSVRQEHFCLRFEYRNGKLVEIRRQPQPSRLLGTHICFDFYVA